MSEQNVYDIVIVGGGPAGLTAAIYASRARLKTLVVEKAGLGGQAAMSHWIENYPGFPEGLSGMDLTEHMRQQAERFGTEFEFDEVRTVEKSNGLFTVKAYKQFSSRAVIIATGRSPRRLNVPGEAELTGKGVSYCATCDGAFYRDVAVAVIGGGDAAVKESLFLTRFASRVYIIHRRDRFRAEKIIAEEALKHSKIEPVWNSVVEAIEGENGVEGIRVKNVKTGEVHVIDVKGVFVYIGSIPNTEPVRTLVQLDADGYIVAGENTRTSMPGVFAAGDVRRKPAYQVATAVADGAIAAMQAEEYITHETGFAS